MHHNYCENGSSCVAYAVHNRPSIVRKSGESKCAKCREKGVVNISIVAPFSLSPKSTPPSSSSPMDALNDSFKNILEDKNVEQAINLNNEPSQKQESLTEDLLDYSKDSLERIEESDEEIIFKFMAGSLSGASGIGEMSKKEVESNIKATLESDWICDGFKNRFRSALKNRSFKEVKTFYNKAYAEGEDIVVDRLSDIDSYTSKNPSSYLQGYDVSQTAISSHIRTMSISSHRLNINPLAAYFISSESMYKLMEHEIGHRLFQYDNDYFKTIRVEAGDDNYRHIMRHSALYINNDDSDLIINTNLGLSSLPIASHTIKKDEALALLGILYGDGIGAKEDGRVMFHFISNAGDHK